jgi:hypothetical protein
VAAEGGPAGLVGAVRPRHDLPARRPGIPLNTAWYPPRLVSPTAWYLESHSIAPAMVSSTFGIPHGLQARFNLQLVRGSERFGRRFQRPGRFGPSGPA